MPNSEAVKNGTPGYPGTLCKVVVSAVLANNSPWFIWALVFRAKSGFTRGAIGLRAVFGSMQL